MVDKINGNSSFDYPNQQDGRKGTGIKAYENTPGRKEKPKYKSADSNSSGSRTHGAPPEQKGVILDLSSGDKKKAAEKQKISLMDTVRRIVSPVIAWIKNFWESGAADGKDDGIQTADIDAAVPQEAAEEDVKDIQSLPPLDEVNEIPDYESMLDDALKSRDLKKMQQLLTQNGARHPAHSTDLLTYYDRRGKLVEMDDTQKHRVLFGDKNIFKL